MGKLNEILFRNKKISRILAALCVFLPAFLSALAILVFKVPIMDGKLVTGKASLIDSINFNKVNGIIALVLVCVAGVQLLAAIGLSIRCLIKARCAYGLPIINLVLAIAYIAVGAIFKVTSSTQTAFFIISIVISVIAVIYCVVANKVLGPIDDNTEFIAPVATKGNYLATLALNVLSLLALSVIFFIPLYSGKDADGKATSFIIMSGFSGNSTIALLITFLGTFVAYIVACASFLNCLKYYFWKDKRFSKMSRDSVYTNFVMTILFFAAGEILVFVLGSSKKATVTDLKTIAYVPFLIEGIITIIHSFFNAKNQYAESKTAITKGARKSKWIILLFVTLFTGVTMLTLTLDLVTVKWAKDSKDAIFTIIGWDLLLREGGNGEGWQVVTFLLFAIVLLSVVMYVLTFTAVFAKSSEMKRLGLAAIMMNFFFVVVLGLFGKYFQIAEDVNTIFINQYIQSYYKDFASQLSSWGIPWTDYTWEGRTITSNCFYMIFADLGLSVALFLFKPFTKAEAELAQGEVSLLNGDETLKVEITNPLAGAGVASEVKPEEVEEEEEEDTLPPLEANVEIKDFDACPAFTELDYMKAEFDEKQATRVAKTFQGATLPELVKFIVEYAREDKKHLSYTHEDIATFIAGLGATKLSILQGMSGTGKTSLPLIFLKALMGNCEIVEVESSWKDKNELIGYYNEFSKVFTPKKFTRALYKAALNPDVITLIVLDEMNLSRIEYYFSDFLSLMENDPEAREIQLCNVKLYNTYKQERHSYQGLKRGHTLHIPENVWFIGTANRDESTFEISDKVYDRANTINFDKRAPKVRNYTTPLDERYLTYGNFQALLDGAVSDGLFDLEAVPYLKDVEALLRPYNISFGNRILNQIEKYVKIYAACFTDPEGREAEALEKILLSKVVHKLEFKAVEDKQSLVRGFEKIGLMDCAEFVKGLNEDF